MRIYRQTQKPLGVFLSREQRLVYSLCREEVSDILLAQRSGLALDLVREILKQLCAQGLVELVAEDREAGESIPSPLEAARIQLREALQAALGEQAVQYLPELETKQSLAELEEWARRLLIKLRLAISQKAASILEAELKKIF
ncbi:MAG: hypothetical protein NZ849_11315 [Meiothermus sp.]|uniref:hypothetical protein n=1 Tax=Meiothermus sp. TaxID=1955249 RepID=UPI0025DC43C7|nr:hypothetical protein [Meiothermus sp.]MCS7059149.1 hypothetical protein [Meiothermus sp.]MCS7195479.1 hypothetical protein [Meiothermus sp.]MCX7741210.1 hypothetical protein [Meiothermus sp.]MDW8090407.1 hypothetical protein [Meiothermus sp.]MDW8481091.1 hypothetical protein [Meiothermus sp.]